MQLPKIKGFLLSGFGFCYQTARTVFGRVVRATVQHPQPSYHHLSAIPTVFTTWETKVAYSANLLDFPSESRCLDVEGIVCCLGSHNPARVQRSVVGESETFCLTKVDKRNKFWSQKLGKLDVA